MVYEEHRLYDRAGWGIIFESGRHDGFNACEVEWFLTVTGEVVARGCKGRVRERPGAWSRILNAAFSRWRSTWRVPGLLQGQSGLVTGLLHGRRPAAAVLLSGGDKDSQQRRHRTRQACGDGLKVDMPETFTRWDAAEHLSTKEEVRLYLEACAEEDPGDGSLIRLP